MGAIIPLIIQALPAGIQLGEFIANLIHQRTQLQQSNRPDVDDATIDALTRLIDGIQAHIDAQAAKA